MKIRAIITGATGMVGEGVLLECLVHPDVEKVLVVGRRSCNVDHPKLRELILLDLFDPSPFQGLLGDYNACFFCLGVSSVGMKESEYRKLTYDLTLNFAEAVLKENAQMAFCYVSGAGTDSSETSRSMWSRVKGKTENDLLKMPFRKAYMFRPAYIHPTKGLRNTLKGYKYLSWSYPFLRAVFPRYVSTLREVGQAMIKVAQTFPQKSVLEVRDIVALARR
jgi:uncharacterized protein YbjT (DUF2867 family)